MLLSRPTESVSLPSETKAQDRMLLLSKPYLLIQSTSATSPRGSSVQHKESHLGSVDVQFHSYGFHWRPNLASFCRAERAGAKIKSGGQCQGTLEPSGKLKRPCRLGCMQTNCQKRWRWYSGVSTCLFSDLPGWMCAQAEPLL